MASVLEETTEFVEDITQFDTTDPILGGPDGIDNEPHKQLAARTNWLRRKLESETRQIVVNDAEGVPHYMVWIPRIILPAGALGTNIPSQDLYLGGFAVDQFLCAVDGGKAISHPLKMPTNGISFADAQTAAAARVIEGTACDVLSAREWGHLAWLVDLIGHPIEGNQKDGASPGNCAWDGRGEPGTGLNLGVSGPASWYHNGLSNGIKDLVGNLLHYVTFNLNASHIVLKFEAELANDVTDSDPSINIASTSTAPQGPFYGWPVDGFSAVILDDGVNIEYFDYDELLVDPIDSSKAQLNGCTRGASPHAFSAGTPVIVRRVERKVADAWVAAVAATIGANPSTDTELIIKPLMSLWTTAPDPLSEDIIRLDSEDMRIVSVDGDTCQVERGYNGTTAAEHSINTAIYAYSRGLTRTAAGIQTGYATGALRTGLLEEYYLRNPGVAGNARIHLVLGGNLSCMLRGGRATALVEVAEGGTAEVIFADDTNFVVGLSRLGFRCVWRPNFD